MNSRSIKSSLKNQLELPSWEAMSRYWKSDLLVEMHPVWRDIPGGERQFCGLVMDPREFLPLYMRRFLRSRELGGDLPEAGNYRVEFKVYTFFFF